MTPQFQQNQIQLGIEPRYDFSPLPAIARTSWNQDNRGSPASPYNVRELALIKGNRPSNERPRDLVRGGFRRCWIGPVCWAVRCPSRDGE